MTLDYPSIVNAASLLATFTTALAALVPGSLRRSFYAFLAAPFAFFLFATVFGVEGDFLSFPLLVVGAVLILAVFLYVVVGEYYLNKDPEHGKRSSRQ